jgi:DNA-directed RNA polymerase specialized sigma24 family protein/DNA-binding MarR family transcriptional regulator
MELLYNPDRMPEEEIKATFVAREQLVDELVALVEGQPDGAGVQHAVIIAPRGMGKTTVLLMVKFAIKDRGLADRWQAVKFPEESYCVYDLADFWVETLHLIAADTADTELRQLADNLKIKYPKSDELQEAAYAALKDWRRKHGKRLLLLVENFDQILEQINDERDNARLRDALMNDGEVMLLGGATTFFKEARAYDQPLYNFFKIYNLADLKFAQMQDLLRRRAEIDRIAGFEAKLQQNTSRLRALEYFTSGNPRLLLVLYRVVGRSDVAEVRRALEKLLDEVTPYYKAKVEALPAQQRKILDHIARISGETNEGLTPGEIAAAVRLPPNQVSSQLKRLSEFGYVRVANLRGRSSCFALSEPLYAIWHQMRFGRDARKRMGWLVSFLKAWFSADEFGPESERLDARFREYFNSNRSLEAYDILEYHQYLAKAMMRTPEQIDVMNRLIDAYLDYGDITTVKSELLLDVNLEDLPEITLSRLCQAECISAEQMALAKVLKHRVFDEPTPANAFDKFLEMLNTDRELAGNTYELLRQKLIVFFSCASSGSPEDLADKTLDRMVNLIARRPKEIGAVANIAAYCFGVAKNILRESWRQSKREVELPDENYLDVWPTDLAERRVDEEHANEKLECLESCLQRLSPENGELIVLYYQGEGRARLDTRRALAERLGISLNALAIRSLRIRSKLEVCIIKCLEEKYRSVRTRHLPRDWEELIGRLSHYGRLKPLDLVNNLLDAENFSTSPVDWKEQRVQEQIIDLLAVIRGGNITLAKQLIKESNIEGQLFPLARALDYLETGDEALIEKLSPEVRGIVEEVVAKLKETSPAG